MNQVKIHEVDCDLCPECMEHTDFHCCEENADGAPCKEGPEDCNGENEATSACCG